MAFDGVHRSSMQTCQSGDPIKRRVDLRLFLVKSSCLPAMVQDKLLWRDR